MEPTQSAGAAAFIGSVLDPGNTYHYYVPYAIIQAKIPGVYVSQSDGAWLSEQLASGPVRVRLSVDSRATSHPSYNIVGDLPGRDEEIVMIGSHHDGPWDSAVEDASGTSLVLAQARYWSRRPASERPHRLRFILHAGHMAGGAGIYAYIKAHRKEFSSFVLEVHLEHVALDTRTKSDGSIVPIHQNVPRWFFTSRHASLEQAVSTALTEEKLTRSMLCAPDALGTAPPTDGGLYYTEGIPIAQFLSAPWYLFDSADTLDKIDRASLIPLTRAVIRIVDSTRTTTAAELRAEAPTP